jgi:hypothetical protein
MIAGLLGVDCKRRLRAVLKVVPDWMAEELLGASERIGDDRATLWINEI